MVSPETGEELPVLKEIEEGKEWDTSEEQALEELRAQQFAAEGIWYGGISGNQLGGIVQVLVSHGYKPNNILNSIVNALRQEGSEVDSDLKSTLWWFIKDVYAERQKIV